jgi:hypothetical protein
MLKLRFLVLAVALFGGGIAVGLAVAADRPAGEASVKVALDNPRVSVSIIEMAPGARRPGRTRPTDELVLFCDEAHYQAVDVKGQKQARDRKPGEVVWHPKGDLAPTLVNTSDKPVHYYGISLK